MAVAEQERDIEEGERGRKEGRKGVRHRVGYLEAETINTEGGKAAESVHPRLKAEQMKA